jgi:hypothetical protein
MDHIFGGIIESIYILLLLLFYLFLLVISGNDLPKNTHYYTYTPFVTRLACTCLNEGLKKMSLNVS